MTSGCRAQELTPSLLARPSSPPLSSQEVVHQHVRARSHEWYQSLTVGTIYSLVFGLRFEDPRLPSPRCGRSKRAGFMV